MIWIYSILIVISSALLWRIRGGLKIKGKKLPVNKIWYAVAFAFYGCLYFGWSFENWTVGFADSYVSYQAYGWGLYIGCLLLGCAIDPEKDRENELIDDLLYSIRFSFKGKIVWLYEYPKLFGFLGTSLTGLIITFLWGLFIQDLGLMLSGLGMGLCYALGGLINNEGKNGWNLGEWIFGAYEGAWLAWVLLW